MGFKCPLRARGQGRLQALIGNNLAPPNEFTEEKQARPRECGGAIDRGWTLSRPSP
jgi:hypothetical protein